MSKLDLTIISATLNKDYDLVGKMENYVKLVAFNGFGQSSEYRTKIISGSKDVPIVWNESVTIPLKSNPNAYIDFQVLDEDATSDEVCGKGRINLLSTGVFTPGPTQRYQIRLFDQKTLKEISGSLSIATRYS